MATLPSLAEDADLEQAASTVPAAEIAASVKTKDFTDRLASHILLYSFVAAVVLAIGGFIAVTAYLFGYLNHAVEAFNSTAIAQLDSLHSDSLRPILATRSGMWKFILQSCGIMCGAAFGFLGFALFLLGAKGEMDANFDDSLHKVQITRMAPGAFVILIAAILIGLCAVKRVDIEFPGTTTVTTRTTATPAGAPAATQNAGSQGEHPTPGDPAQNGQQAPARPLTHVNPHDL